MRIGVPNQVRDGERRVAIVPETVGKLLKAFPGKDGEDAASVHVQSGAGVAAAHTDDAYKAAGAVIESSDDSIWACDVVACVAPPAADQVARMQAGSVLLGMLRPGEDGDLLRSAASASISAIAFETVPRITRAQKVDVLSAMSTIAGYRAVILSAEASPKLFPMLMTAAGTITPVRVVVLGAGVAGLQAIATARRLGAIVEAFDIRAATKEQVESLGARFIEIERSADDAETAGGYAKELTPEEQAEQRRHLADRIAAADVVITTALVPGRPAPRLIDEQTVRRMRPGSVILDMAAEAGGNCALTKAGGTVNAEGVSILGPLNLPSQSPIHASLLFSRIVAAMLDEITADGRISVNPEDDIMAGALITHAGEILHGPTRERLGMAPLAHEEVKS
jgi:NAD(P) transhydrogenase subunit alpha